MIRNIKNNVKETTTSTGYGNITLLGAFSGYSAFDTSSNERFYYGIIHQTLTQYEFGLAQFLDGEFVRLKTIVSSNSNAPVNFSVGTKDVILTENILMSQSSSTTDGWLSASDYNSFQPALGFTPENVANKTDLMSGNTTSSTKYLSAKGVYDWVTSQGYTILTAAGFGTFINGLTGKTTPVDADEFILSDSASSNVAKKVTGTNFKAYLKTYFDTLYQAALGYTAEDTANKSSSYTLSSTTTYANTKALVDGLATKQDTLVSGTNIKTINGSSILGSGDLSVTGYDPLTSQIYFQDFAFDNSQGSTAGYAIGTNGGSGQGGALLTSHSYTNALGIFRLTSGTSANTGLAYISNGSVAFNFKPSMFALTGIDRINLSVASDGTNRYIVRSGFMTQSYNSEPTAGVYFRYTDNVNSGKWQCVCRSGGTETVINTTTAPKITTSWDKLGIVINAAGTSVEFFINDVSQGTITTNIPTTTYLVKMVVMNKISGGSSQLLDIDCVYIKVTRTI